MDLRNKIIAGLVLFLIGGAIGYYATPKQIEQVEVVKEKERVKTVTVTKEITRPDGTKERETSTTEDKKIDKSDEKKLVVVNPKDYFITVGFDKTLNPDLLTVNRRIMGNVFVGAYVNKEKQFGVSVGLEF